MTVSPRARASLGRMGGIGFGLKVQRSAGEPSVDDSRALRTAFWEHAQSVMYRQLGRPGNRSALEYASDQVYDHADRDAGLDEIHYTFMDCAGCCNRSMEAAYHWFTLALAMDPRGFESVATRLGFTVELPQRSVAAMVRAGSSWPLFHADHKLWAIGRRVPGQPLKDGDGMIFGDSEQIEPSALSDKDRAVAERISLTGRCHCELCSQAR